MSAPSASAPYEGRPSSSSASAPPEGSSPPSYSSLFPDHPPVEPQFVGCVNANQYGYPPYTPYPQQQYVSSSDGAPLVSTVPVSVRPKPPEHNANINPVSVVYVGIDNCPLCRVGILEDDYPIGAICYAILFFPIGLICCLALRQKRCNNCGYVVE